MAFAFTHLIVAWIVGTIYQKITKKTISHNTWFFLLFGSILPDADLIIDWVFKTDLHRTFSHSILFAIIMFTLVYFIFYKSNEKKQFATAISAGILTHVALDILTYPGTTLLWPSTLFFSLQDGIMQLDPSLFGFSKMSGEQLIATVREAIVDMGLGTAWLFYLWFKKKIQF